MDSLPRELAAHARFFPHEGMLLYSATERCHLRISEMDEDGEGYGFAVSDDEDGVYGDVEIKHGEDLGRHRGYAPDLSDPATAGCLLALLADTGRLIDVIPPGAFVGVDGWAVRLREVGYESQGGPVYVAGEPITGATLGEAVGRALLGVWG